MKCKECSNLNYKTLSFEYCQGISDVKKEHYCIAYRKGKPVVCPKEEVISANK